MDRQIPNSRRQCGGHQIKIWWPPHCLREFKMSRSVTVKNYSFWWFLFGNFGDPLNFQDDQRLSGPKSKLWKVPKILKLANRLPTVLRSYYGVPPQNLWKQTLKRVVWLLNVPPPFYFGILTFFDTFSSSNFRFHHPSSDWVKIYISGFEFPSKKTKNPK